MPSPPTELFGTPAWFDQMPTLLPKTLPEHPDFVVEHRGTTPLDETVVHQQIFSNNGLIAWIPGRATPNPDLTLIRSTDCDAGDLLGRLTATEVINNTKVVIGQYHQTCPLGVTNTDRPGLAEVAPRTVDFTLDVANTPFGNAGLAVRLNPDGTQHLIELTKAETDIALRLQWPALTEWLHTDTSLGNLFTRGDIEIDGPFLKITYIDGHLSWPPTPQHLQHSQNFKQAMDTYCQLRQNHAYLDLMDEVDETAST